MGELRGERLDLVGLERKVALQRDDLPLLFDKLFDNLLKRLGVRWLEVHTDDALQLARRAEKLEQGIAGIDKKLANQRFVDNADPAIVDAERERRAELVVELESLQENLAGL